MKRNYHEYFTLKKNFPYEIREVIYAHKNNKVKYYSLALFPGYAS